LLLILFGSLLAAPLVATLLAGLVRPLTRLVPGAGARLAADNLLRAPGRTGVVVGAIAAGTAMSVQLVGVAASNERPVVEWIDASISADLFVLGGEVSASTSSALPLAADLADELRHLPGVRQAVPVRFRRPTYRGTVVLLIAFDATRFYAANRDHPDYPGLELFPRLTEPGAAVVSDNFAALFGVRPGDTITLPGVNGPAALRVVGTLVDYSWNRGGVFVDRSTLKQVFDDDGVDVIDVFLDNSEPEASATGERAVRTAADRRALVVATRADLRGYIIGVIRRLYALVQVQQLVVGAVAALGVVTALLISVLQRRRELGLLRAVGATRAQVLRSVLAEAALVGLCGTLFGLALGVPIEWYMVRVVLWEEAGFVFPVLVPWREVLAVAGGAAAVATLAGLGPALHAGRLNIAEAVTVE
jgi:putative ABC transport system permease protein